MSDRIREIQNRLMNNLGDGEGGEVAAAIAYIPLVGWIYPYFFKKDDDFCRFHASQALKLNLAIVALYFGIWILENFPLTGWLFGLDAVFHPLTRSIWLIAAALFLGLSGVGAFKAISDERWEVPYIMTYIDDALDLLGRQFRDLGRDSRKNDGDPKH